jgi:hypothetical protein
MGPRLEEFEQSRATNRWERLRPSASGEGAGGPAARGGCPELRHRAPVPRRQRHRPASSMRAGQPPLPVGQGLAAAMRSVPGSFFSEGFDVNSPDLWAGPLLGAKAGPAGQQAAVEQLTSYLVRRLGQRPAPAPTTCTLAPGTWHLHAARLLRADLGWPAEHPALAQVLPGARTALGCVFGLKERGACMRKRHARPVYAAVPPTTHAPAGHGGGVADARNGRPRARASERQRHGPGCG